jgi:predicted HAD superfamily Cof-like phosphohydrolase
MIQEQTEVKIFQQLCGQPVAYQPTVDTNHEQAFLYAELVREEAQEIADAFRERNIVGVADGAADLIWVVFGLCNAMGIDLEPVWKEVRDSNMSKIPANGQVLRREDGKILKPETYFKPNIEKALGL